ncbi:MAG: sulfatase-like hydrolase/transferase, partial [Oscillospiraceae bacterium]|nr:sulfatase-like hydrolase/transferase [Oscillospiraceae bacterium]
GDYFGMGRCPGGWDGEYWYDMRNYLEELTEEERFKSRQSWIMETEGVDATFTYAHRCADRAEKFLKEHGEEDFLLCVSFDEPHGPSLCPEPYASMYKGYKFPKLPNVCDMLADKPEHQRVWAGNGIESDRAALEMDGFAHLLGCNSFVDSEIGRVLAAADRYADDAMIIYTSDHGDFMESHCLDGKGPATYDEIVRIPMIMRQKGVIEPGGVYNHPVSHLDIAPTVLQNMGIGSPELLDGKNLSPVFSDPETRINEYVFTEFFRYETDHDGFGGFQPLRGVFDGRHKLTVNLLSGDELYDLRNDPYEMKNLIMSPEHEKIRDGLHDVLLENMNKSRDPFRGYHWERRPWRTDAREASWGYTRMTRQREHEEYEPKQLDYNTGLPMESAVRRK